MILDEKHEMMRKFFRQFAETEFTSELLDELDETIPSSFRVEEQIEAAELSALIDRWLAAQKKDDRILFVRRYYFGDPVKELAAAYGCSEQKMAQIMLRLRRSLKKAIEQGDR